MSFDAIKWAMDQRVDKATAKFVLVAMADCVNGEGSTEMLCWPSTQHLIGVTNLDRKTVGEALRRLREAGFIEDTGERRGITGQIPVYRLRTPPTLALEPETTHYIYRLTDPETGEFYIGVRSCSGRPEQDTAYRGSGAWCQLKRLTGVVLKKEILGTFPDRGVAEVAERQAITEVFGAPLCRNRLLTKQPKNGIAKTSEVGLVQEQQTNPDSDAKRPEIPSEATQFSLVTDPKAGYGTTKEPRRNKEGTTKRSGFDPTVFPLPEWVDRTDWIRWCNDRRTRKKPITEDAAPLQLKALATYRGDGFSPREVIDHSIANAYQGLYPPKRGDKPVPTRRHGGFRERDYSEGATDGVPDA